MPYYLTLCQLGAALGLPPPVVVPAILLGRLAYVTLAARRTGKTRRQGGETT